MGTVHQRFTTGTRLCDWFIAATNWKNKYGETTSLQRKGTIEEAAEKIRKVLREVCVQSEGTACQFGGSLIARDLFQLNFVLN